MRTSAVYLAEIENMRRHTIVSDEDGDGEDDPEGRARNRRMEIGFGGG